MNITSYVFGSHQSCQELKIYFTNKVLKTISTGMILYAPDHTHSSLYGIYCVQYQFGSLFPAFSRATVSTGITERKHMKQTKWNNWVKSSAIRMPYITYQFSESWYDFTESSQWLVNLCPLFEPFTFSSCRICSLTTRQIHQTDLGDLKHVNNRRDETYTQI